MRIASYLTTLTKASFKRTEKSRSLERLASGHRINSASDDAAGLAVSQKLRALAVGSNQSLKNIMDGISLVQTAESGLADITTKMQRARELAVQACNDTLTDDDRAKIQQEIGQIKQSIDETAANTEFNTQKLLCPPPAAAVPPPPPPSTEPILWQDVSPSPFNAYSGITWSGSLFVASGTTGKVITSPDGVNWTERATGVFADYQGIIWTGTQFVMVGTNGRIVTSNDGLTWTPRVSGTTTFLMDVAWDGSQYVAVGLNGTIRTSTDAITWTNRMSGTANTLRKVVHTGGQFIASGDNGTILTSPDGITWTSHASGSTQSLYGLATNGSQTVAVGWNFPGSNLVTSSDGVNWTISNAGINLRGITWDGSRWIAAGQGGTVTSTDGINWTIENTTSTRIFDIIKVDNKLVAVGDAGKVYNAEAAVVPPPPPPDGIHTLKLQVGPNAGNIMEVETADVRTAVLGVDSVDVSTRDKAEQAIGQLDAALEIISDERSRFDSAQNALEHIYNNVSNSGVNLTQANSRIEDADMVQEMLQSTMEQILTNSFLAITSQATDLLRENIQQILHQENSIR